MTVLPAGKVLYLSQRVRTLDAALGTARKALAFYATPAERHPSDWNTARIALEATREAVRQ